MTKSSSFGDSISLVGNINLQFSKSRPFNPSTDAWSGNDVTQRLYDVRGGYTWSTCFLPGNPAAPNVPHLGQNCFRAVGEGTKGACFRDTFGDWHCKVCCTPSTAKYSAPPGPGESQLLPPALAPEPVEQPAFAGRLLGWPAFEGPGIDLLPGATWSVRKIDRQFAG